MNLVARTACERPVGKPLWPDLRNSFHFIKNEARPDDRDPILRGPFPFPMRVSARLLGDGLVREDSDPNPATTLDESRHGNSCGLYFSAAQHPHSMACSPKSPKFRVLPREAFPLVFPFCCFRYFVFAGINMAYSL